MIEFLDLKRPGGRSEQELWVEIEEKVNELIEAHNALEDHYKHHQHKYWNYCHRGSREEHTRGPQSPKYL